VDDPVVGTEAVMGRCVAGGRAVELVLLGAVAEAGAEELAAAK